MSAFDPWAVLAELDSEAAKVAKPAKAGGSVSNFSGFSGKPAPEGGGSAITSVRAALRTAGPAHNGATSAEISLETGLPPELVADALAALLEAGELHLHEHPRACYRLGTEPVTAESCVTCRVSSYRA